MNAPRQTLGFQHVERLGCGRLRTAPFLGDSVYGRQRVTRPQFAALDALPQVGGDAEVGRLPGALIIWHMINAS